MGKYRAILSDYFSRHDFITNKIAESLGIQRHVLYLLKRNGELVRIRPGVYAKGDDNYDRLYEIQLNRHRLVYSHETALHLYFPNLFPLETIHVSVPQGYNTSHINDDICFHYVKPEDFFDDIEVVKTLHKQPVRVLSLERSLQDILCNKKP